MQRCYLVSGHDAAWLCSSLSPLVMTARFCGTDVPHQLAATLCGRPGARYRYMEACEIDCDIVDGVVVRVRSLIIDRAGTRITLI